jgi:large conductance mechanosensitive channel
MGLFKEFMDFIKKQNIITVALALITGFAAKTLIDALVADLIAPLYEPYIGLSADASITLGLSVFKIGDFLHALISFIVILLVVFIIAKKLAKTM